MGLRQTGEERQDLGASEEAAVWLQRLRIEDTAEMRAEFSAWVRKGAKNLEEFLFAQAIWKEMDQIDPAMRERLRSVATPNPVVDFPSPPARSALGSPREERAYFRNKESGTRFVGLAAASLVCALAVSYWWMGRTTYATEVGEQISVKLPDGSMMHLNTDSRAVVNFSAQGRTIRLESGEALFTVERDPKRPFDVLTARARIRALGTEFNVRSSDKATRIAVVNGAVQVSSVDAAQSVTMPASGKTADLQLRAGDEAQVEPRRIVKTQKPNIERAVSWRGRRLMFPGDPVGEIAEEFNRYNKTTIRIEGADLQRRRMSGVFDADDPSPLVRYLERDPQIEVVRDGDEIVIRSRRTAGR